MPLFYFRSAARFWLTALGWLIFVLLVAFFPLLIIGAAGAIADNHGCTVNEASSYPCVVGGIDLGGLLSFMVVFGWFFMMSFPVGMVLLIAWINKAWAGIKFLRRGSRFDVATLKNLSEHEFDKRIYLEATIDHQGKEKLLRIVFKHKKEETKYKQGKSTIVGGFLGENADHTVLILSNSGMLT